MLPGEGKQLLLKESLTKIPSLDGSSLTRIGDLSTIGLYGRGPAKAVKNRSDLTQIKAVRGGFGENAGMDQVSDTKGQTMTDQQLREIVHIDEDLCDGCGQCVPSCAEGAIRIVDGKAKLVADNLCDGLGNCLGTCPKGAIRIETRQADAFDERAVAEQAGQADGDDGGEVPSAPTPPQREPSQPTESRSTFAGCPGARLMRMNAGSASPADQAAPKTQPDVPTEDATSRLGHWPVQLALLPVEGDIWADADVLMAADCVAFAMPDFHERLLAGRTVAVACPKLDDTQPYVDKLAKILTGNEIRSLTIARMSVPCCGGLEMIVQRAIDKAGVQVPVNTAIIGPDGRIEQVNGLRVGR